MNGKTVNYHYTQSGLPNIWIRCRCVTDDAGKRTAIIPNVKGLHLAIAREVVNSRGALTGREIKFLRSEMGMTPAEFGKLVHREPSTVARWEHCDAAPDGAMDTLIRILAIKKLKLKAVEAGPDEISGKYVASATTRKTPIHIKMTDRGQYQLAA